jgi:hypothetical protein
MSVTTRQNRLLIAEDWKKIYQSFRNANFQSYDFETLRRTMIDYIRVNYPEDFNDYIESSEYLALIDLVAFLGQSISFRVDLNARENFLELAERRDSVLRLARLISYNAKRNTSASGLLKFNTISTTENVIDSNGRNLANQVIGWNDSSNSNWYDQFIKVMNASFPSIQQFGNPADSASIYGIPTQQYQFNSVSSGIPIFTFTKTVAGRSMNFEIVSTTFSGQSFIYEDAPKVGNQFKCVYRDDGHGASSPGTGFFVRFVQGTLNTGVFSVTQPSSNQSIDIDAQNINDTDVWLYKLDSNGIESGQWTSVSNFESNNVIYNSLNKNIRDIFAVLTRANDAVSLQFSDGTFGNLPLGSFRTYYRVSNGLSYTINTSDIRNVSFSIPYISQTNQVETLTINLNLATSVSNATVTETNASIKANAPATFYTQNRMITGEDYNISPLSANGLVSKIKAINRTSSGISRYFDLIDPTGKYSSTTLFADDGVIYLENYANQVNFTYNVRTDIEGIIYNTVFDILKRKNLRNFYYTNYINLISESLLNIEWVRVTEDSSSSTGYIKAIQAATVYPLGSYTITGLKYFTPGSLVKFTAPAGTYFNKLDSNSIVNGSATAFGSTTTLWAEVVSVVGDGTGVSSSGVAATGYGAVTLNQNIPEGAIITQIIPKWRTVIDTNTITTMIDLIFANKPFGLSYNASTQAWQLVFEVNLDATNPFSLSKQGDNSNQSQDASWMLLFTTDNITYTITSREQRYVFESDAQIRFYFDSSKKIYDSRSSSVVKDYINVLSINAQPTSSTNPGGTIPFTTDQKWDIISEFIGLDGYVDSKKLVVSFADEDDDGVVDDPETFLNIVNPSYLPSTKYIVLEKYLITVGQEDYRYVKNDSILGPVIIRDKKENVQYSEKVNGQYFYFTTTGVVMKYDATTGLFNASLDYKVYPGRDGLKFQYNHSADYDSRIDAGASNIIDIYVLTKTYDTNYRQWLAGAISKEPLPPGSDELHDMLAPNLNLIKSISDEVVYHPVKYKLLFGPSAAPELQATFKVVKNSGQVVSDNDIKSRIIGAINQFFLLNNWDFGDTFYFTELSTYVVTQLSPDISNFVIVPKQSGLSFGSLFEIKSGNNELFISSATVDDVEIISGITASSIKAIAGTTTTTNVSSQQSITSSKFGSN